MRSKPVARRLAQGSSDEGEATSGATGGGGSNENADMEENGSTRTSSNSSSNNNPVYRDPRSLQAPGGAHEVSQDYNQQSWTTAYQRRGYSPGMELRQRHVAKKHPPLTFFKEEERKSSWDYGETNARKEYSRSRDYSSEYQDMKQEMKQELKQEIKQEPKDHSSREWVSPIPAIEVGGSAPDGPYVRARKDIPRGEKFGPYLGKWAGEPFNPRYAWEICIADSGVRGWLDASHETNNWLKYIRSTANPHAVNMRYVLNGGQLEDFVKNDLRKERLHFEFSTEISFQINKEHEANANLLKIQDKIKNRRSQIEDLQKFSQIFIY